MGGAPKAQSIATWNIEYRSGASSIGVAPVMFVVFSSIYSFIGGMIYAAYAGATLETIGQGAAATKFNLLGCVSNVAVVYMPLLDGWAQSQRGSSSMLFTEAALGIASAILFMILVMTLPRPVNSAG